MRRASQGFLFRRLGSGGTLRSPPLMGAGGTGGSNFGIGSSFILPASSACSSMARRFFGKILKSKIVAQLAADFAGLFFSRLFVKELLHCVLWTLTLLHHLFGAEGHSDCFHYIFGKR